MFLSNSNVKRDKMSFDCALIFVGTLKQASVNSDFVFQYNSRPWLVELRLVLTRTLKYRIAKYLQQYSCCNVTDSSTAMFLYSRRDVQDKIVGTSGAPRVEHVGHNVVTGDISDFFEIMLNEMLNIVQMHVISLSKVKEQ